MTGDQYDFDFLPTSTTADKMILMPGRARLGINELDCTTKCTYLPAILYEDFATTKTIEITVRTGASYLMTGVLSALTAASLLAF